MTKLHQTQVTLGSRILEIVGAKYILLCTDSVMHVFELLSSDIIIIQSVISFKGHVQCFHRAKLFYFYSLQNM
jgi:hypothetical protein